MNHGLLEKVGCYMLIMVKFILIKVVVVTGAGRGFCAGGDLSSPMYANTNPAEIMKLIIEFGKIPINLRNMPKPVISAINGAAVGAAMSGLRPIAEIQFNDFLTCAMDQICNQAAKIPFMMGGQVSVPIVIRTPMGATGRAAQHSQSLEAWFMHTPGLKVVMPSTP